MTNSHSKKWKEAELLELGFHKIVIGIPGRPLPVMVANPLATGKDDAYRLESIEDDQHPIVLWSQRPYDEVIGMLYRLLPTPSMLPLFYETLQLLQVENDRRIQFYIGKHGSGKSFLGRLIGDMLHPDGAIAINCADRDLNELLFETVLDVSANPDLYTKINQKLKDGTLNATSIAALKSVVGESFIEKDGAPYIEFEKIGASRLESVTTEEGLHETEAHFDNTNTREVVETLLKIAQVEGLSKEASFMPLKSQLGLLPRIWLDGRVAHLEEYNKCKEGTDTCLHPVLQVLNGENSKCTVYGSGGMHFTFDRKDIKPGFFCYLDGNMQQDGVATHMLSASANDRILPNIIQDMIQVDWQHRWCQMLTGLPLKILYESKRDQWDTDPETFTKFLKMIRKLGVKSVPDSHLHYIDRWEEVMEATDIISKYNKLYDEMTNPDSVSNKEGKYPELFTEVDEEFYNMAGGSMRRNIYYFKMALLGRPATRQPHQSTGYDLSMDWSTPPVINVSKDDYHPEEHLGTHIVEIFFRDMIRLTLGLGKPNLYTRLKAAFESLRMLKPKLAEGMEIHGVYLEDLLNSKVKGKDNSTEFQKIFCEVMRAHANGTPLSATDDDLMTQEQVKQAFQKAREKAWPVSGDQRFDFVRAQNLVPLVTVDNMIADFALIDDISGKMRPGSSDLMDEFRFLTAIAFPGIGKQNIDHLWSRTLIDSGWSPAAGSDAAVKISSRTSPDGIAFTTIWVKNNDSGEIVPVHFFRNDKKNVMLVVGRHWNESISERLASSGIDYVSLSEGNAKTKIRSFVNRQLMTLNENAESRLVASFFHRNSMKGMDVRSLIDRLDKTKFADLLFAEDIVPMKPVYATNLTDRNKITAFIEQKSQEKIPQ